MLGPVTAAEREVAESLLAEELPADRLELARLSPREWDELVSRGPDPGPAGGPDAFAALGDVVHDAADGAAAAQSLAASAAAASLAVEVEGVAALGEALPSDTDLLELNAVDPWSLNDPLDRLAHLRAWDRLASYVAAGQARALVAVVGRAPAASSLEERHLRHEVEVARGCSMAEAGRAIDTARALSSRLTATADALATGQLSPAAATALVAGTSVVTDPVLARAVEAHVLPEAPRLTPRQLRRAVSAAACALDPDGQSERHLAARASRAVWTRRDSDGMGFLGVVDDWATVHALFGRLTDSASALQRDRGGAARTDVDPDTNLDACRADALAATVLDHAEPFPRGPSDPTNCRPLCITHHQLKTAGLVAISETRPDGSCRWTTGWGQTRVVPRQRSLPRPPGSRPAARDRVEPGHRRRTPLTRHRSDPAHRS